MFLNFGLLSGHGTFQMKHWWTCCLALRVQVRDEVMRVLETSAVTHSSDVLKCTVEKADGLPRTARGKQCLAEVNHTSTQATLKKQVAMDGTISYAPPLLLNVSDDRPLVSGGFFSLP
jgi:hypothetical protein